MTAAEVIAYLAIPERTFFRHYLRRFTDGRPADRRKRRVPHVIRRAEVELVRASGWEALAEYRERTKQAQPTQRRATRVNASTLTNAAVERSAGRVTCGGWPASAGGWPGTPDRRAWRWGRPAWGSCCCSSGG